MLLLAQETTSEIHGLVKDGPTAVPGAVIIALHNPTGTKYITTTRKDGRYNVPNVRVGGPYTISVSYIGYKEQKIENITLSLGQEFTGDFSLVPDTKQLGEIVIKSGKQDKTFNNNRTGAQEIISRDQLDKLPTINRSAQDFTRLEPTSSSTAGGQSFGGRSNQYNNFTVDGANFNNSFGLSAGTLGGQTGAQPISLDAIDQIQVNVSPFDVRQGGFSGAGVNSVTKSGTNTLRATAYTYIKGAGTQGYKVENTVIPKTALSFNIRGASIGGPIIRNKVFFFLNGESSRQTAPATSWIASDANHAASNTNGVSLANADTLAALASFLKTNFGYDPGAYAGYSFKTNSDKITAKIDWNINDHNTVTFKYNYLKSSADQFASASRPAGITGGQPSYNSMPFFGSGYVVNNNFNIFIAELNSRFGNSASNKFQVGYTALRDFRSAHSTSSTMPFVDILNNGNIYTSFGYEPYTYNNVLNTDVFQISDIFTLYKGAHEITFGTQDYYRKYKNAFAPGYQGAYQFNSLTDFYNSVNNGTMNARNYYLQYSALSDGSFPWAYAGSTELGVFAQDKWRVRNNFTLTYGLRLDMTIYKQAFTDNPYFNALTFKDGSYNIGKAPGNALLISPRVGFNWDVMNDKTLQVRGGFGIFSGPPPFVWISNQASNNGIQWGSFTQDNVAFKANPNAYRPESAAANTAYSVALADKNFKYPSVIKTNLAVDKKLADDWIFTVEGSYSKDVNAVYYSNINLNETNAYALQNGGDNRLRYNTSLTTTNNTSNKYYSSGSSLSDPNIGTAILMKNTNKGYSYYVTGRIQKTFNNLYVSAAYTHSDARNTAETGSTASSLWSARAVSADPNAPNLGYASYRMPNRIIAMASYKVSYGKYFSTSFGAILEVAPAGVTSYIYNGDLNGDGYSNDLIYIPKSDKDINLINVGSYNATTHTGSTTGTTTDPRTAAQTWTQLNNFINQSGYLSAHRGEVSKANAVVLPYYKKVDVNITQDISVKTGKDRHTLRLSLDVINVGNLLNKNWGIVKAATVNNFLKFEGLAADGKTPLFSFPYADASNQVHYTNSFANNTAILSRWQMQFGVRYLFN
jgi:hypothetical protein